MIPPYKVVVEIDSPSGWMLSIYGAEKIQEILQSLVYQYGLSETKVKVVEISHPNESMNESV